MSDDKGNTPQDRRAVALSEDHERRHFVEQFVRDNPGITHSAVIEALDAAAAKIAPSEDRDKLKEAVQQVIGSTNR
jgi:hypothetical protein